MRAIPMSSANVKIIEELKEFISIVSTNPDILKLFTTVSSGFSRKRKLSFERLVLLIAKLCKKTLSVEIEQFFKEANIAITYSVSAFSQQRTKLNPEFYVVWNELLCACFYHYHRIYVKRWKGYRLVAGDGSNVSLVKNPALESYFGGQGNQSGTFVQGKTFYLYDILNRLVLYSKIAPYRTGELTIAYPLISNLKEDMLMIYDRNFCNYKMFALHLLQEKEIKFVIRAKDRQKFVKSFIKSGKKTDVIWLEPTPSAIEGLYDSGFKITSQTRIKVRLVRVQLPESIEVLVTNLWEEDGHPSSEFKELYNERWGIETNISLQKNILQLESFSGLTTTSVKQDFYATVFTSNLFSILVKEAQNTIDIDKANCKHPMQANRNKAFGKLKANIVGLFFSNEPKEILRILYTHFIRDPLPVRPNRTFPRIVKNKQSKSKHKTFTNYKPAY